MFERFELDYSMKNISLPSQKEYILGLIYSVETFVKNLRWRAYFFLNPQEKTSKNKYGFKTLKAAPKVKELQSFEDGLFNMVKDVKFKKYSKFFSKETQGRQKQNNE